MAEGRRSTDIHTCTTNDQRHENNITKINKQRKYEHSRVEKFHERLEALDINYANHLYEIEGDIIVNYLSYFEYSEEFKKEGELTIGENPDYKPKQNDGTVKGFEDLDGDGNEHAIASVDWAFGVGPKRSSGECCVWKRNSKFYLLSSQ